MDSTHPDRRKTYVRIADELREDLTAGRFAVGEPFPSIADLASRFTAAKATVERAVDVLRTEGLLESRQGSRTIVLAHPDVATANSEPGERSEEFQILMGQLKEIRGHIKQLGSKLAELDERTKDL